MRPLRAVIGVVLLLASAPRVRAERLPLRIFTTADGLAHDSVNRVVQDSRGYVWICTDEGLSRFDGYGFRTYGVADGLPGATVMDILETGDGLYWVATFGGLARLSMERSTDDRSAPGWQARFEARPLDSAPEASGVRTLHQDRQGVLWVGTVEGLYRVDPKAATWSPRFIDFPFPRRSGVDHQVNSLVEDHEGTMWIATRGAGLLRLHLDGRIDRLTAADGLPSDNVRSLLRDEPRVLWAGTSEGICRIRTSPEGRIVERSFTLRDGLPHESVRSLLRTRAGRLYAATDDGLALYTEGHDPTAARFRAYAAAYDLPHPGLVALSEDRDGNVWIGSRGGLAKLARGGFTTYGPESGFEPSRALESLLEDRRGTFCAVSKTSSGDRSLHWLEGERFERAKIGLPLASAGWGWGQTVLQDSRGDWLVPTGRGIFVFSDRGSPSGLADTLPREQVTQRDGLEFDDTFRLFEDSRGGIWISPLRRWDRRAGTIESFPELPAGVGGEFASAFAEDTSGAVWIGMYGGGLLRHRSRRFDHWTKADGLPAGSISSLHIDRKGRLWIGGDSGGVARVDDPLSGNPSFDAYTIERGLSSNEVNCITEDRWGRIYLGTGRGVDRLDPETGRIRRYTSADGLARSRVHLAFRDRSGSLWFGTERAVSRLDPVPDESREAPDAVVSALRIAGAPRSIHPLGETLLHGLVLGSAQSRVEIEFLAVSFAPGEVLRYQYRLEGASGDWSTPSERRSVNYVSLSPGRYRFQVRTVTADGAVGSRTATVAFTVLPPFWRTWWFLALLTTLVAGALLQAHRLRLARLVAIERMRTRIATDLHDDIGASLTQIALQSEVLRRELTDAEPGHRRRLEQIGSVSRELVDAMSDIVWAINPRRDRLRDLVQRMRRFALDTLDAGGIALRFEVPEGRQDLPLGVEERREVYLAFKECITNAARHSGCRKVDVLLRLVDGRLELSVQDDGRGFDPGSESAGTGLASLRRRVEGLRGSVVFHSESGEGTRVEMSVPHSSRRRPER